MKTSTRAGIIATVLTVDGVIHCYWATGAIWPARTPDSLSRAVLNIGGTFTPQVVLPIAALLWVASGLVLARSRGRGGRLAALGSAAVGAGLTLRGIAGLVWVTGMGSSPHTTFYWLNLLLYTPTCLTLAPLALAVARGDRSREPAGARPMPFPQSRVKPT